MKRLDNYLRITLGLSALVWGAAGRAGRWGSPLLTVAGAMKVAEGITGYRPMLQAIASIAMRRRSSGSTTFNSGDEASDQDHKSADERETPLWRSTDAADTGYESSRHTLRSRRTGYRSDE